VVLSPTDAHGIPDGDVYALADRYAVLFADRFADRHVISYSIVVSYLDTEWHAVLHVVILADKHTVGHALIHDLCNCKLFFHANKFAELFADALKQYHDNPSRNKYAK